MTDSMSLDTSGSTVTLEICGDPDQTLDSIITGTTVLIDDMLDWSTDNPDNFTPPDFYDSTCESLDRSVDFDCSLDFTRGDESFDLEVDECFVIDPNPPHVSITIEAPGLETVEFLVSQTNHTIIGQNADTTDVAFVVVSPADTTE